MLLHVVVRFKFDFHLFDQPDNECGGTYFGNSGWVTSPKYPCEYENNHDCMYNIVVPDMYVRLTVEEFSTDSDSDFLEVSDR